MVRQARELERTITNLFSPGDSDHSKAGADDGRKLLTVGEEMPAKSRKGRK